MPKYRACRFRNVRECAFQDFEAANDEAAKHMLQDLPEDKWEVDDIPVEDGSATDEVLGLDELDEQGRGTGNSIVDEIEVHGQHPYGFPSQEFVRKVAAILICTDCGGGTLIEEDYEVAVDAIERLQELVAEARKLCASEQDAEFTEALANSEPTTITVTA